MKKLLSITLLGATCFVQAQSGPSLNYGVIQGSIVGGIGYRSRLDGNLGLSTSVMHRASTLTERQRFDLYSGFSYTIWNGHTSESPVLSLDLGLRVFDVVKFQSDVRPYIGLTVSARTK